MGSANATSALYRPTQKTELLFYTSRSKNDSHPVSLVSSATVACGKLLELELPILDFSFSSSSYFSKFKNFDSDSAKISDDRTNKNYQSFFKILFEQR